MTMTTTRDRPPTQGEDRMGARVRERRVSIRAITPVSTGFSGQPVFTVGGRCDGQEGRCTAVRSPPAP